MIYNNISVWCYSRAETSNESRCFNNFVFFFQIYEGTAQIQRLIIAREHIEKYKN